MTRLTISQPGDSLTFRPVTSTIVRKSKDGDIQVVILLFGTHYNISMNGILQETSDGDIDPTTQDIATVGHELQLTCKQKTSPVTSATLQGSFSSFMYFYPGLKIKGHLKLSETSHSLPVPLFSGRYHFTDLLNGDQLNFGLTLEQFNTVFTVTEVVSGVSNVLYSEALGVGIDEYYFEFDFLINGKSKIFKFLDWETLSQTRTRVWIGDMSAALGECNVQIHNHNTSEVLKTVSSDHMLIGYPQIFTKFDRTNDEGFVGQIQMWDTVTELESDESLWLRTRSRDYRFTGDRVIENGMIRIIIRTSNPVVEIYGWNYNGITPSWELCHILETKADNGSGSLKVQNVKFEYFSKLQLKGEINFGTSIYSFIMTRGDPYITLLNKAKSKLLIKSNYDRMGGDFDAEANGYTLLNCSVGGHSNNLFASGTVSCASVLAADTVTLNGVVYTAVAGAKANNTEFSIDTGDIECAADLADSINNDTRDPVTAPTVRVSADPAGTTVTLTCTTGGVIGNLVSLVSSNGTRLTVSGAVLSGGADSGGGGTETLSGFSMLDNYFGFFDAASDNQIVGWMSNIMSPTAIDIVDNAGVIEYTFTYPQPGNIIALGVLPSVPNNLVGGIPFPFVVGTQDQYIKWRGNEAVLSFRELETIKKR